MAAIPPKGRPHDEILEQMQQFAQKDPDYKSGRTWSMVYHLDEDHDAFLKKAHNLYFSENALNPTAFRSLKRFEHEVVRMTANLLNGNSDTVGVMTSGGTESCLLPVLAAREKARAASRWKKCKPEMVVPQSVHVAWDKAAKYFNIKLIKIPLTRSFTVDVEKLEKKLSKRTILVVASAPSYPHGVIDPIEDIARITRLMGIPFHVDSCLGGFMLPFIRQIGYPIPLFDFQVEGVTSMSADVHKYGFAAKGASIVLYKNMNYLKHQFFIGQDWPGGLFASPALLGTRPGGPIAAAWAAMNAIGLDGYRSIAAGIMETTNQLISGIEKIEGLAILGKPAMSVLAFSSVDPKINIFAVGDRMEKKGWHVDRLQKPEGLHAMVTPTHHGVAAKYLDDLKAAVTEVKANPDMAVKGNAALYGMIAHIPFRGMIKKQVGRMMAELYGPENKMPMNDEDASEPSFVMKTGQQFLNWFSQKRK